MIAINTEIPKELKKAIKLLAVEKDTTFKQIVIEALTAKLKEDSQREEISHDNM